jgi:flagellar biosynthesis protein FlhB
MSDKTEAPTQRRIAKAREKGDVAVSAYAAQAVGFWVALLIVPSAVQATVLEATTLWRRAASGAGPVMTASLVAHDVVVLAVPMLVVAAAASALVTLVQTGGLFAPARIAIDLARLDPIAGIQNLLNVQRLWMVGRAAIAAAAVGWLAYRGLRDHVADLANATGRPGAAIALSGMTALSLCRRAALVGIGVAVIDWIVTRHAFFAKLRMTKADIKKESRESEGDPHLKAARRRAHQEMLAMATVHAVRDATVVIVNPQHLATALRYRDAEDDAPTVVANGDGELARRMIDAARAYGVPVMRDVPVARALSELEVGDQIPEALYEAVAEILRTVWDAEKAEPERT